MLRGHTTGKKPRSFACQTCGRAFETQQLQRIHEMSHSSGAPYCEICGKQFARGASLVRHLAMCRIRTEQEHAPNSANATTATADADVADAADAAANVGDAIVKHEAIDMDSSAASLATNPTDEPVVPAAGSPQASAPDAPLAVASAEPEEI
jgi:hypothetical protein